MSMFFSFSLTAFFSLGIYFLVFETLARAARGKKKAFSRVASGAKKSNGMIEEFVSAGGSKISRYIRLNEWNRRRLNQTLSATGKTVTAEQYTAEAIVRALIYTVPATTLGIFIHPLFYILGIIIFAFVYFISVGQAERTLREKREAIEYTLPRFVTYISQSLHNSRDLLKILESYIPSADDTLARELKILIADMRTGNYEMAIMRFDARLTSPSVSELARGLIGVLRGDDSVFYFQMLLQQLKAEELQKLEKEALKRVPKIRRWSFVILALMMLTYMFVLGMYAFQTASAI